MSENLIFELDALQTSVRRLLLDDVELEKNFHQLMQNADCIREHLNRALMEKQNLENLLVEAEKQRVSRADKLKVAQHVIEREREFGKEAAVERDRAKLELEKLLQHLPEHLRWECHAKIAQRIDAASVTNTDIDVTTNSTFYTTSEALSSAASEPGAHKPRAKTGFAPMRASSRVETTSDLGDLTTSGSLLACTTFDSDDSRRSAEFYSTILENLRRREHTFHRKTFVLGEPCAACATKIVCGKRGLVCADCRCVGHEKCAGRIPKPCIPAGSAGYGSNGAKPIADYGPRVGPRVPAIVVHCVLQVEERGLNTAGLYKIPTFDRCVDQLKHEASKNRGVPNLNEVEANVVGQFLKDFFASLRPALISADQFEDMHRKFVHEGRHKTPPSTLENVLDAMSSLQQLNRDTFVFLLLHLQKVAASKGCNMSARRLSRIFTPILVDGYKKGSYADEQKKCKLLETFIELPSEYWKIVFVRDV